MHKLIGPMPRDDRWSPRRDSLPVSIRLRAGLRSRAEAVRMRVAVHAEWRLWWDHGGRATVVSLIVGPPPPMLAGADTRRRTATR